MKKLFLILLIGLSFGCARDIESWKIYATIVACQEHGGVSKLVDTPGGVYDALLYCNDGSKFKLGGS